LRDPTQPDPLQLGEKEAGTDGEARTALAASVPPAQGPTPSTVPPPDQGPTRNSFAPGMLIAEKYVVERVLGEGGIGVVVAAKHVDLDQTVAIKYLRPQALTGTNAAERFLREARLAAKIRSDHIVHVYDVGRLPDGSPYMVMEYLAGTDLGRLLIASGPLSVDRAVDYVLQACEALAQAHVAGIVHRDLKPENLFVSTGAGKSVVKILDFGISKLSAKRTTSDRLDVLTHADDKFGTPVYMSPEQLRASRDVDARADVWAVGVVLYELLTGVLPFEGDLPELCTAILTMPPIPLTQHRPYLPVSLQSVIERCLEKEADKRFQNVAELAQELRPFAAAAGHARIDHVVSIIREAGEPIQAATPAPGEVTSRLLHQATTLGAAEGRLLTTGSAAASWRGVLREAAGWKRRRAAIAAALGVAVIAVVASLGLRQSTPEARAPATAAAPAEVTAAAPPSPAVPPPESPPSAVPSASAPNDPAALQAATTTATPPRGRPRPTPSPTPSAAHRGKKPGSTSSPYDSSGVINPFE
jgi:eukaryotic-like serine/threonine-protein kinase